MKRLPENMKSYLEYKEKMMPVILLDYMRYVDSSNLGKIKPEPKALWSERPSKKWTAAIKVELLELLDEAFKGTSQDHVFGDELAFSTRATPF